MAGGHSVTLAGPEAGKAEALAATLQSAATGGASVQAAAPGAPLDVPIAGDDAAAKVTLSQLVVARGLRAIDAGPNAHQTRNVITAQDEPHPLRERKETLMTSLIDPDTRMGVVALSVADLVRSLAYYQHTIGLAVLSRQRGVATLGAGDTPLLRLHEVPGARLVRRATGLYHFALRLPARRDLARLIRHFADIGYRIGGAADHIFSEALYLSDPDGHGIEIEWDRPRDGWFDAQGNLRGASDPLDLAGILEELDGDETPWNGLPADSDMGHVHLQVADIRAAERFYLGVLGFERMVAMPSASFISAGRYHHHLGMNTWAGARVAAPPAGAARLLSYAILLPSEAALGAVLGRLRAARVSVTEEAEGWAVRDPSQNCVLLRQSTN
jgi:catechol 2,3-dioxygenase